MKSYGLLLSLLAALPGTAPAQRPTSTSLVVLIAVDQLRPDYLKRYNRQFTGGFRRLLDRGAVFENGQQFHALTETAPGHATMLSGREPVHNGIVNNAHGVVDPAYPVIQDSTVVGASPMNFRGTTLYDWMLVKDSSARVLSVSRKDRAAILMVGRAKGDVYWYNNGRFSTSRYYADSLPAWVQSFNARRGAEALAGRTWDLLLPASEYAEPDSVEFEHAGTDVVFPHRLPATPEAAAANLRYYPWMDSLTAAFALEGVRAIGLGRRDRPDLLSLSFSTTDYVGHTFGPDSREIHDQLLRLDRWLGRFLDSLSVLVPAERTVVVLTADHGVQRLPELTRRTNPAVRRIGLEDLATRTGIELTRRYRVDFAVTFDGGLLSADTLALHARGVKVDSLASALAAEAGRRPGIRRVFTPTTLRAAPAGDREATLWRNQMPDGFGWLLGVAIEPGFVWSLPDNHDAVHGSTAPADVTVPIIFYGKGIRPIKNTRPARTVDIAPTLAALLGIRPTEPLDGRVLQQVKSP